MSDSSEPQTVEPPQSGGISRNVRVLGWVSLFNDAASEMLYPIMPLFLTASLGASPALLGLIDGLAEGIGTSLRWIGGMLSDRLRRRKPLVIAGYTISAFSKPVMGLAAVTIGWPLFMVGRCADRLGKSVRNAARDALIAASSSPESRGRAFGYQRAMDTVGAVAGPLIAFAIIIALTGWQTAMHAGWNAGAGDIHSRALASLPLKWLYFVAVIPGLIAVLFVFAVREIRPKPGEPTKSGGKPPPMFQSYPARFWRLVLAAFVFSLGNSSDTFLILRSSQIGLSFGLIIFAYVMYNIIYALASEPLGGLSDRIGRRPLLICGWAIYAAVYAGFAILRAAWAPWLLLGIYGFYQAMTDGVTSALISDVVPDQKRAGAIGLFSSVTGLGQFVASLTAGAVYSVMILNGHVMLPFAIGAVCPIGAILILATAGIATPPAQ